MWNLSRWNNGVWCCQAWRCMYVRVFVVTKDRGRACDRFSESTRKFTHSFMALGRARARTTALPGIPAKD